jgi:S-formylglutathione hydrolase
MSMSNRKQKFQISVRKAVGFLFAIVLMCACAPFVLAQEGRLVREKVHGTSLEKTVTGESADRTVSVYLPPSYDTSPNKRYPVVYLLHGITDTDEEWITPWTKSGDPWQTVQGVMNRGIAEKIFGEMIIVMPDELTKWGGSFYTNSTATGNWEDFTVKDLVSYIDRKYRTLARPSSRGIAGHSMGGYGAIKLGMKHPDVYTVIYGMNPAVLDWGRDLRIDNPAFAFLLREKIASRDDALRGGLYALGIIVVGQAFSPNPERAPLFFDLPFAVVDGEPQPAEPAFTKWNENMPVQMVQKYASNLRTLRGLRFDSGYEDEFTHIPPTARALSAALTARGIDHKFEEYNGDHRNRMWGRTGRLATEVLPYFWMLLDSEVAR